MELLHRVMVRGEEASLSLAKTKNHFFVEVVFS
jgi:hypothetical protein